MSEKCLFSVGWHFRLVCLGRFSTNRTPANTRIIGHFKMKLRLTKEIGFEFNSTWRLSIKLFHINYSLLIFYSFQSKSTTIVYSYTARVDRLKQETKPLETFHQTVYVELSQYIWFQKELNFYLNNDRIQTSSRKFPIISDLGPNPANVLVVWNYFKKKKGIIVGK